MGILAHQALVTLHHDFITAMSEQNWLCQERDKSIRRIFALLPRTGDAKSHVEVVNEYRKEEDEADIAVFCSQGSNFDCHVGFLVLRF